MKPASAKPMAIAMNPAERLDAVRCLLLKVWQGYDAAGHSNGRSLTCGAIEAALHLLEAPRPEARTRMEAEGLAELIQRANEVVRTDREAQEDLWFKHLDTGDPVGAVDKYVEQIRAEIESGFENRMR